MLGSVRRLLLRLWLEAALKIETKMIEGWKWTVGSLGRVIV